MSLLDSLSNATSGLNAQSYALSNISGNIANTTTAGFKGTETRFADMLAQGEGGTQPGGGVTLSARSTVDLQGTVAPTGVATNLAISGDGYFVVRQNTGSAQGPAFTGDTAYTRRGDFTPDASGYLVNGAGYYLFAGPTAGAPVQVPVGTAQAVSGLSVSPAGALGATLADGTTTALGTLSLARFGSQDSLASLDGGGTYAATAQSGAPSFGLDGATVTGGSVEQSNASVSDQFSKMIETQQAYSANTKVLDAANEMLQDAITMYV